MKLAALQRRVRSWQRRSGLSAWTITVAIKPKLRVRGRVVHAATTCVDQRADIEFDAAVLEEYGSDADALDQLICHELQHIIDDPQEEVFIKYLGGDRRKGLVYQEWEAANEKSCDHRAAILVTAYRRKRDKQAVR